MTSQDPLEQQLEKLFSDVEMPPSIDPGAERVSDHHRRATPGKARRVGAFWRGQVARLTESLGLLSVFGWVLVVAFALMQQVSPTSASVTIVPTTPASAVAALSTPSPTLQAPTRATTSAASPTSTSAASSQETSTPTPTVPTTTPTPTDVPPTPTLPPVQPVHPATATPAFGLGQIPTPVPLVSMPDNAINIVLLGSDQRPYEQQWRTDVVIVVSVNPDQPSVSMLSIPRDTWLYIPNWTKQRINLADVQGTLVGYPGGGPGLVKATIEYNFGIHVDYFARVNFAGLIKIVDTLGGVDVLLDCPVEDGFPDDPITEDPSVVTQVSYPEPGLYHIDGKHALWLARSRKTTSEFARSRRQHRILQGIWAKANDLGYITSLPELWEDLTDTVETDLTLEQVMWLASIGLKLDNSQIHSGFIDGRYLRAWVSPGGANVLLPNTEAILEAMEPLFNPYPYQAPQGFNKIEVWNGSGRDNWGYLAADKLMRNGFEVTAVQPADQVYEHSVIVDFTTSSKGSPLPLLQNLFDANTAHASAAEAGGSSAPFRFIVGADYQSCEWPTPAQWTLPTPTPEGTEGTAPEN